MATSEQQLFKRHSLELFNRKARRISS